MNQKTKHQTLLDSRKKIAKLDKSNALGSVEALADQVREAWEATQDITFKAEAEINSVVIVGMGGSGLGPDVVKNLFKEKLKQPLEVINSYTLPEYVDDNTLVIFSSYSGNTEEVLNCIPQAEEKNAQMMAICSGGKLAKIAQKKEIPVYIIDAKSNPSGQPRMAIGYAIIGMVSLLIKANIIDITEDEIKEVIQTIIKTSEELKVEIKSEENKAKILAFTTVDKQPIFVTSEHLVGAAHVATNQFNENAKTFADYKVIPEINHHLLEGLRFPNSNRTSHVFLFINSKLYHSRNQLRHKLTQQVVEQNEIETMKVKLKSETKLTQVFELITLMAFTNFYLSMLHEIDPCPIPFVDWFKEELKKA